MDANSTEIVMGVWLDVVKQAIESERSVTIKATDITIKGSEIVINEPEITVE